MNACALHHRNLSPAREPVSPERNLPFITCRLLFLLAKVSRANMNCVEKNVSKIGLAVAAAFAFAGSPVLAAGPVQLAAAPLAAANETQLEEITVLGAR